MPTITEQNRQAAGVYAATAHEHWIDELNDGRHVLVRPLTAEDRQREYNFIKSLSRESRHARFLGEINEPGKPLMDQLMDVDNQQRLAFIALVHDNGQLIEIGVARYAAATADECECAVTVADTWQHLGLGRILMQHLMTAARANGFRRMYTVDKATNAPLRDLTHALGFHSVIDPDDSTQVISSVAL
ncbi:Acetyltransferase (GNAT) family protein [Pseudomonas grimontii]|uniref:Acetyltransferase (GNAT) family protein n=1 Tax=Pseudomonas grimontii TaxID=129847 RepID=A0A1H1HCB3_9PSED|nr:GNAT family N-acetyltransferase [Pseudomonas grimontii]TWR67047.1 GNAT family N-acetyltransferase [Pseudomonas grimontii]SDR23011.1 Acetyltransferase (GNAT) family protein [Pseudomonas grimontii]